MGLNHRLSLASRQIWEALLGKMPERSYYHQSRMQTVCNGQEASQESAYHRFELWLVTDSH